MEVDTLEDRALKAMQNLRQNCIQGFGKTEQQRKPSDGTRASTIVTELDKLIQTEIVKAIAGFADQLKLVAEETDQSEFMQIMKTNEKAEWLLMLDPLDGTYGYSIGKSNNYGIIFGLAKRVAEDEAKLKRALIYYPHHNSLIRCNDFGVFREKPGSIEKLKPATTDDSAYHTFFQYTLKRLGLPNSSEVVFDLYSVAEMLRLLFRCEIPGFLSAKGHHYDNSVTLWIAQRAGYDLSYGDGSKFKPVVPFLTQTANSRNEKGLIIAGNRQHAHFQQYLREYKEKPL